MGFKNQNFGIVIGLITISTIGYVFYSMLHWSSNRNGKQREEISYEMIRTKSDFRTEYSLNDREVEREFINPFEKKKTNKNEHGKKSNLVPIKKSNSKVGAKDDKKQSLAKNKGMKVNIVSRDQARSGLTANETDENYNNSYRYSNLSKNVNNNILPKEDPKLKNKTTSASGYLEILEKPSTELANQLIQAYRKGEVSSEEYYGYIDTLVRSNNPKAQSIGIYLSYNYATIETFSVVTLSYDQFSDEVKVYADQFLSGFNSQSKLSVLGKALQSENSKIVLKAGEIVISGLQKVKKGQNIEYTGREGRGNNNVTSISYFQFLLPIVQLLTGSNDQNVAVVGSTIMQEMSASSSLPN